MLGAGRGQSLLCRVVIWRESAAARQIYAAASPVTVTCDEAMRPAFAAQIADLPMRWFGDHRLPSVADHSDLSAVTGSTWAARYAGPKTAITRTTASTSSAPVHDHGSSAFTW